MNIQAWFGLLHPWGILFHDKQELHPFLFWGISKIQKNITVQLTQVISTIMLCDDPECTKTGKDELTS